MTSMTGTELDWIGDEIAAATTGGHIQKIHALSPTSLALRVRQPGRTLYLIVELAPSAMHLRLGLERPASHLEQPTQLVMLLRKWIQGARLMTCARLEGDRVIMMTFRARHPETEERVELSASVELFGARGNFFLLDAERTILGQLHGDTSTRALRPRMTWRPPERAAPEAAIASARFAETALDPETLPRSAQVARAFAAAAETAADTSTRDDLTKALKRATKRARRLVRNIEADLARAEEAEGYRRLGELLQSAYGKVERGASCVEVPDYYAEGMPSVRIDLDPSKDLQGNIDHYFHQYRRMHQARAQIEERLLAALEKVERLEQARAEIAALDDGEALEALRASLVSAKLIAMGSQARGRRKQQGPKPPYRVFRSSRGSRILVGRNASANDELTTRHARGRDIWMHARDWAGSHVVVPLERGAALHPQDLLDAAMLAAHFSRGRGDTIVEVTHTEAKNVRKPKGFPPGRVTVAGGSSIAVSLEDEARLRALLESEQRTS